MEKYLSLFIGYDNYDVRFGFRDSQVVKDFLDWYSQEKGYPIPAYYSSYWEATFDYRDKTTAKIIFSLEITTSQ
jgi:hypothetical protein